MDKLAAMTDYEPQAAPKADDILGNIEKVDTSSIAGWVLSKSGKPIQFLLAYRDSVFPVEPEWAERTDVTEAFGLSDVKPGFSIALPSALRRSMTSHGFDWSEVSLIANNQPLILPSLENESSPESSKLVSQFPMAANDLRNPMDNLATMEDPEPQTAPKAGDIIGKIESVDASSIQGWVLSKSGSPIQFQLAYRDSIFPAEPEWTKRPDVAEAFGLSNVTPGFSIALPSALRRSIASNNFDWSEFLLVINGRPLALPRRADELSSESSEPTVQFPMATVVEFPMAAVVEWCGLFAIWGWVVDLSATQYDFEVRCNEHLIDCPVVVRTERKDVAEALKLDVEELDFLDFGFELELPGYIWEFMDSEHQCAIAISVNGRPIHREPIVIVRSQVIEWFSNLKSIADQRVHQYRALLALEHIRFSGCLGELGPKQLDIAVDTAKQFNLEEFLFSSTQGEESAISSISRAKTPTGDMDAFLTWRLQRRFNERVKTVPKPAFENLKELLELFPISGEAKLRFILTLIPYFCRREEFLALKEILELDQVSYLERKDNAWELSLFLPVLLASRQVRRATDVLWKICNHSKGWLNTECVWYSLKLLTKLQAELIGNDMEVEKFAYAIIGLLDSLKGGYWTRLNDTYLIKSMVLLVSQCDHFSDFLKQDVVAAAIRNYGLCPSFWREWNESSHLQGQGLPEVDIAGEYYARFAALLAGERDLYPHIGELTEILQYFREKGNYDSGRYLLEVSCNAFSALNRLSSDEDAPRSRSAVRAVVRLDPAEAIRIGSYPLDGENHLTGEIFSLKDQIRKLTNVQDKCPQYNVQFAASRALAKLCRQAGTGTAEAIEQELTTFIQVTQPLNIWVWGGYFLRFDLCTSAYLILKPICAGSETILPYLWHVIQEAIRTTDPKWYLPAPVLCGLSKLANSCTNNQDPLLTALLEQSRALIQQRFGNKHDAIIDFPVREMSALDAVGSGLFDTLVVIYSCRKYLDTRVAAIRETWINDLREKGIPYVVIVGDGDDRLNGDVLALNVSDRYEDLPQKTLKMFEWVYENTRFQYIFKIDDDCYLDVDGYFDSLSYKKFHYYGRIVRRPLGGTDRVWHHPKSQSHRGRKAIDKSPEPSVYADGGGGYCVSRLAISRILSESKTAAGTRLIASSFMEDKLVGDLLSLSYIEPSDEDYYVQVRRRLFSDAMPVSIYDNTFYPSTVAPTKVAHLDTEAHMDMVWKGSANADLLPKRIWPTYLTPSVKSNSNQLELLSDEAKLALVLREQVIVICVVRNENVMLPHFLAHYRGLGVRGFIFVDNLSDDGTREYLFEQEDVVLYSADTEYKYSHFGVAWQQAILGNHCVGKWVLLADADEFLVFPGSDHRSLWNLVEELDAGGHDAALTLMIDMYPYDDLSDADLKVSRPFDVANYFDSPALDQWELGSGYFSNSRSYLSALRHRIVSNSAPNLFISQKYCLFRYFPWIHLSEGLHYVANINTSETATYFAHFKYHAGFKDKIVEEVRRKQHFNDAEEYRRYQAMLSEGQGGFGREGVSIHYSGSSSFLYLIPDGIPIMYEKFSNYIKM
jgi:hypothetical protein